MRIGTPSSSVNCLDGADFFPRALGAEAIRVPRPAAGMMTTTFIEGDQYTAASVAVQIGGLLGRFPKFNAVPLWIHDPGKAAVVVIFAMRIDFDAFFFQRVEEGIEIVDPVVDHEAAAAGIEIFRVTLKYCPYGHSLPLTVVCLPPLKHRTGAVGRTLNAQVPFVPVIEFLRVVCLEKDAAYSGYALHKKDLNLRMPRESKIGFAPSPAAASTHELKILRVQVSEAPCRKIPIYLASCNCFLANSPSNGAIIQDSSQTTLRLEVKRPSKD